MYWPPLRLNQKILGRGGFDSDDFTPRFLKDSLMASVYVVGWSSQSCYRGTKSTMFDKKVGAVWGHDLPFYSVVSPSKAEFVFQHVYHWDTLVKSDFWLGMNMQNASCNECWIGLCPFFFWGLHLPKSKELVNGGNEYFVTMYCKQITHSNDGKLITSPNLTINDDYTILYLQFDFLWFLGIGNRGTFHL